MLRQRKIISVLLILLVIPILGQTGPCGVVDPGTTQPLPGSEGPIGPQGPAGPQGPQGEPGLVIDDPDEVADALKNDSDFLEAVKGDPGAPDSIAGISLAMACATPLTTQMPTASAMRWIVKGVAVVAAEVEAGTSRQLRRAPDSPAAGTAALWLSASKREA